MYGYAALLGIPLGLLLVVLGLWLQRLAFERGLAAEQDARIIKAVRPVGGNMRNRVADWQSRLQGAIQRLPAAASRHRDFADAVSTLTAAGASVASITAQDAGGGTIGGILRSDLVELNVHGSAGAIFDGLERIVEANPGFAVRLLTVTDGREPDGLSVTVTIEYLYRSTR